MGTQQLVLISVGVVVVAVLVGVGFAMLHDQDGSQSRDSMTNDLVHFASLARRYYHRSALLRGGNNSFGGLTLGDLTSRASSLNGAYTLVPDPVPPAAQSFKIIGIGKEAGIDKTDVARVTVTVWADSMLTVIEN